MWIMMALWACSGGDKADTDDAPATDLDADTDTDADSDADSDADADTDSDADADTSETGTTETGDTATTAATLVGTAYRFDVSTVTVLQPIGVGALLLSLWDGGFLLEVIAETATTVDVRVAVADGQGVTAAQDLCSETLDLVGGDFSLNPDFAFTGVSGSVGLEGMQVPFETGAFSGEFDLVNDRVRQVRFAAQIDTVPLVDLVAPGGEDDAVCSLVAAFGVSCAPCLSGSSLHCLPYEAVGVAGQADPGLSIVPRTAADLAADPACN